MDSPGSPSRSNDDDIPKASKNSSPSNNRSYSFSPSLNISASSYFKDRESDIPYRSGWVRKFKQPREAHSYLPPMDSTTLFSISTVKKSIDDISPVIQQSDNIIQLEEMSNLKLSDAGSSDRSSRSSPTPEVESANKNQLTRLSSSLEGIGAIRSPRIHNIMIDDGDDYEQENEVSNSHSPLSFDMDDLLSGQKSNADVSSLTNRSSQRSTVSYQTDGVTETLSSQSPTLQHLEYLAANSTAALVTKFTYDSQQRFHENRNGSSRSAIDREPNQIPFKELKDIYGFRSRREAMKIALYRSECLSQASAKLVDLLYQYLRKCCGVQSRRLFLGDGNESDNDIENIDQLISSSQKGLSLPASAVGWLSAYLLPTEADRVYQQQWLERNSGPHLPSASPCVGLQNKFGLLRQSLAENVTHLRITSASWPGKNYEKHRKKGDVQNAANNTPRRRGRMLLNFDSDTTYSFLAFHRHLENQPRIDMALFPNIQYLQLDGIPGEWLVNLDHARLSLSRLSIRRGYLRSISSIFLASDARPSDGIDPGSQKMYSSSSNLPRAYGVPHGTYSNLSHLSLSNCGLDDLSTFGISSTWSSLSRLKTLDLSHNEFCDPKCILKGMDVLNLLSGIDLSHNRIGTLSGVHIILGNIKVILLSHNLISNVNGLDKLYSLHRLDLSHNRIKKLVDVAGIGKLPDLMHLNLIGNPIAFTRKRLYRCKIFNIFKDTRLTMSDNQLRFHDLALLLPQLDGASISMNELFTLTYFSFDQSFELEKNATDSTTLDSSSNAILSSPRDSDIIHPDTKQRLKQIMRFKPRCNVVIENEDLATINTPREKVGKKKMLKLSTELGVIIPNLTLSMEKVINYINPAVQMDSELLESDSESLESDVSYCLSSSEESRHSFNDEEHSVGNSEKADLFQDPKGIDTSIDMSPILENSPKGLKSGETVLELDERTALDALQLNLALEEASASLDKVLRKDIENTKACTKKLQEAFLDRHDFATLERTSEYDGPDSYSDLLVHTYSELYFRSYVFPTQLHEESMNLYEENDRTDRLPRIQLYQSDRDLMIWTATCSKDLKGFTSNMFDQVNEQFIALSKEFILACGMAATGRISPNYLEVKGFRGNVLQQESGKPHIFSENKALLLCISNTAIYLIPDFDNSSARDRFPSPIPSAAKFKDACWPHAYCRHPLKYLRKISFDGYGFQRLTLHFKLPALRGELLLQPDNSIMSTFDYSYVIFTREQKRTIQLMQMIQQAASDILPLDIMDGSFQASSLVVENDDNCLLEAIGRALGRSKFTDDVLHYQILYQIWSDNSLTSARRSLVLTEQEMFLFHETYAGDFSSGTLELDNSTTANYGDISMRTIASTKLQEIIAVGISSENPRKVSITIKSQNRLTKPSHWFLLCQDHFSAERLTEDLQKACHVK